MMWREFSYTCVCDMHVTYRYELQVQVLGRDVPMHKVRAGHPVLAALDRDKVRCVVVRGRAAGQPRAQLGTANVAGCGRTLRESDELRDALAAAELV